MSLTRWICNKSAAKQMFVKIVHPGGHVELHDTPVLAADILNRNPKFCVAHPNVFQQPWAILAPETTLLPGQKFYVVPKRTVRRLQSLALMARQNQKPQSCKDKGKNNEKVTSCLSFRMNCSSSRLRFASLKHANKDNDGCFTCLGSTEDRSEETKSSSETKTLCKSKAMEVSAAKTDISPKRLSSFDNWQPGLESIIEE